MPAYAVPPGAPKKQVKRFSRLSSIKLNDISSCLFDSQPLAPTKKRVKKILKREVPSSIGCSVKAPTTPLAIRTAEAVLTEIEKSGELKKFYDQLNNNEVLKIIFLRQLRMKPCNVCEKEFISNFQKEHPEVNGLPKPDPEVCDDADLYLQSHPEESFYYRWAHYQPNRLGRVRFGSITMPAYAVPPGAPLRDEMKN